MVGEPALERSYRCPGEAGELVHPADRPVASNPLDEPCRLLARLEAGRDKGAQPGLDRVERRLGCGRAQDVVGQQDPIPADLDDPARAQAEFDSYFGRSTFATAIDRFVSFDLVVHGWDLARATGQDERIDPGELARLWESVELFGDAIRSEGTCGPAVDPPPGADERTRLLAHLGRRA